MEFPLYRKQVPYLKRPTPQVLCSTWTSKKSSFREGQGLMIHSFGRRRASTLRRAPVNIESQKNGTQSPTPAPTPGSSFGGLQLRPPTPLPTPEAFGKNLGDKPRVRLAWRGETPGETGRMVSRDAERRGKKPDARDARARSSEGDRGRELSPPLGRVGRKAVAHARGGSPGHLPLRTRSLVCLAPLLTSPRRDLGSVTRSRAGAASLGRRWLRLRRPLPAAARGVGAARAGGGAARARRGGARPRGPLSSPRPAHGSLPVDTCSAENPILQTLIERTASARHCARNWGFKADRGREAALGH